MRVAGDLVDGVAAGGSAACMVLLAFDRQCAHRSGAPHFQKTGLHPQATSACIRHHLVHMGGAGFGVFVPSGVALAGLDANMVLGQVTVGWP